MQNTDPGNRSSVVDSQKELEQRTERRNTSSFLRMPFFFLSHLDELDKWRLNADPAEIYLNLRSFKILDDDHLLCATVCCVPQVRNIWQDFWEKKSLRNYRRMCLCLPARLQLSTVKAGRGSMSLQNACVCIAWAQKKKKLKENWTAFTAPLQIHCVTQIWQRLTFSISSPRQ